MLDYYFEFIYFFTLDIAIFWTCLSHFQNGVLSHPLQSIVKLLEIKKISVYDKLILNLLEVSKVEVIPMLQLCSKYYTKILCRGEILWWHRLCDLTDITCTFSVLMQMPASALHWFWNNSLSFIFCWYLADDAGLWFWIYLFFHFNTH
jgi:hypothetical protein